MQEGNSRSRGLYLEEMTVGQEFTTVGRTITESDIVSFAGLSGDFSQNHVDREYASGSLFGQRVAHGLLVLSVASGLAVQTGFMEGTVMAFRSIEWTFSNPVFIGDTISVELRVASVKPLPRLGGGSVVLALKIHNQDNKVVQRGSWEVLLKSRA